jgi:hypothetical protein
MCFINGDLARNGREKSAAKYTLYRVPIEKMLANDSALVFNDGYVRPVLLVPLRARIDITDLDVKAPLDEWLQLANEHLAQVTALAAVNSYAAHSAGTQSRRHHRPELPEARLATQSPAACRDAGQGARHCRQRCNGITGPRPPGQACTGKGAAQGQTVHQAGRPQHVITRQLQPYAVSHMKIELPGNERVNLARRGIPGKQTGAATFSGITARAPEGRRNLDDGTRRFGAGIKRENLAFGVLHRRAFSG